MSERVQSGLFHVWFRGNSRFRVFYDDGDFIGFLIRCNDTAKRYNSKITAFVLMDNHVHLQVSTNNLTPFIRSLLISFSQWLNRRKGFSGKLFETPFSSSPIYLPDIQERNILYILTNPVRAGICKKVADYSWSSYHLYEDGRNKLGRYISVDTSAMKLFFPTFYNFNKSLDEFVDNRKLITSISDFNTLNLDNKGVNSFEDNGANGFGSKGVNGFDSKDINNLNIRDLKCQKPKEWRKVSDAEIAQYLKVLLKGQKLNEISKDEFNRIVKVLKFQEGATIQQIASLTRESYYVIKKLL